MNEKIMGLIETARQFKGNRSACVEFGSRINGITVFVFDGVNSLYMKTCYLELDNAADRLETMEKELKGFLS